MKEKILLLACSFCLFGFASIAAVVSVQDAQTVAANYFKSQTQAKDVTATLAYTRTEASGAVDFYVFNMSPQIGFVMVSAIDNAEPILAYSNESYFKNDDKRITGVSDWMDNTAAKIVSIQSHNLQADANISGLWSAYRQGNAVAASRSGSVAPLCTTTWNQNDKVSDPPYVTYLYNEYTPIDTVANNHCYTGCDATAMAQIMKYWNYPSQGTGFYSYDAVKYNDDGSVYYNYGTQQFDFGGYSPVWSDMPDSLNGASTATQNGAISLLMYACGVSVNMGYGVSNGNNSTSSYYGSGPSVQTALSTYFGYNPNTLEAVFPTAINAAWESKLENELNAGRPLLYSGLSSGGGHTWVCDGYESSTKFHMNWGWGGIDNGYYSLSNLNAKNEYDFTVQLGALIGIEPATCPIATPITTTTDINHTSATFNWTIYTFTVSTNLRYRPVGTSTWTTVTVTGGSTYTVKGLIPGTEYEWQVQEVCSLGSSLAYTASTDFTTYCTSSGGSNTDAYIAKVQFRSIQNSSTGNDGGYTNFASISTDVTAGASTYITLTPGFLSSSHVVPCYYTVFIDYNHNGVFEANELVTEAKTSGTGDVKTAHFAIAKDAYVGSTRMRIVMETAGYDSNACVDNGSNVSGDVQDYTVNITAAQLTYCSSNGSGIYSHIAKVQLASIQNASDGDDGYGDFTNISTALTIGSSYYITVTSAFGLINPMGEICDYTVYMDYNHDGKFSSDEIVVEVQTNGTQPAESAYFMVPDFVHLGATLMRVQMQQAGYQTSPCATYTYGDVQDYTIDFEALQSLPGSTDNAISNPAITNHLTLYPNPAQDNLTIAFNANNAIKGSLNVYNLQGQKIIDNEITTIAGNNIVNLNTSTFSNGIYIVEIANNGEARRMKFIISR